MCHSTCIQFAAQNLREAEVRGKRVLEVGVADKGALRSRGSRARQAAFSRRLRMVASGSDCSADRGGCARCQMVWT